MSNNPFTLWPCVVLLLAAHPLAAQLPDSVFQRLYASPGPYRHLQTDALRQSYLLDDNNQLLKLDAHFQLQFTYPNSTLGELSSLDAADPFNLLLFFGDQQLILLLDRTLADRARLDLRTTSVRHASAAAMSLDNNIWVYDDYSFQLLLLNPRGEILLSSNDLRLTRELTGPASHILRWREWVLVNFPEQGIAVFTNFGRLQHWWPISGISRWQALDQLVLLQQDDQYLWLEPLSGQTSPFEISLPPHLRGLQIRQRHFFLLDHEGHFTAWQKRD